MSIKFGEDFNLYGLHDHSNFFYKDFRWDLAELLERLTANAVVATIQGSIPASSDTVESEGRQMKQCWI